MPATVGAAATKTAPKPTAPKQKADPVATLARKLANPGERSKLPISKLPPAMAAERMRLQHQDELNNTLYNPATILAGQPLADTVKSLVTLQTKPQLDGLDHQADQARADNQMVADRAAAYYKQIAADDQATAGRTQQASQDALAHQQTIDSGEATALQGIKDNAANGIAEDARVRGGLANVGTDQLMARLAQNQADLAQRSHADQTALNSNGNTETHWSAGRPGVTQLAGGQVQRGLANALFANLGDIATKRQSVVDTEGPAAVDLTQKLRQQGFDNLITQNGLQLKNDQLQADVKKSLAQLGVTQSHNKAMEGVAQQGADTAAGRLTESQRHDKTTEGIQQQNADTSKNKTKNGPKSKPKTGVGSLTSTKENDYVSEVNTIAGWLQNPPPDKNGKPQTRQQVIANLTQGKNPLGKPVDPTLIHIASSIAANQGNGVGPYGAAEAHKAGIHVNGHWNLLPAAKPGNSITDIIKTLTG